MRGGAACVSSGRRWHREGYNLCPWRRWQQGACSLYCSGRRHGGVHSRYHRERWHRVMCELYGVEWWQWGVHSLYVSGGDSGVYIACSLGQVTTPL